MSDLHGLVVSIAKGCGVVTSGVHEGLSAQENGGDAAIFKGQHVVHTARHAGASVANRRDDEVAALGQFIDDGRLCDARIDEFGVVHGL
jgi:hypothetical protein